MAGIKFTDLPAAAALTATDLIPVVQDVATTPVNAVSTPAAMKTYVLSGLVDTDDTLAADSNDVVPSQQAIKAYVDNEIAALSGGGDVVGPATSTDNAIALFDGAGGTLLQ